ncbi:MAG: RidA family protein [Alphaproteobacteria bacterium]|nr:RidA family protein [Alphaproteobacteria bacterium]MCB9929166.1 RidA family protein [Alphaproteobacteria bacterium]
MSIAARLKELGITLPDAPKPVANYVPAVQAGNLVFVSGQVSAAGGAAVKGKLGADVSLEDGQKAARLCALAILAQVNAAVGSLDKVKRVVKLGGFVACTPEFDQHPAVVNGASDLMVEVFGDKGKHARFAVGVPSLPLGFAVEVDAVVEVEG